MIDGVKIKVSNIDTDKLQSSQDLSFIGSHVTNTGEILNKPTIAELNGMNFKLINQSESKSLLLIQGSLHKFYRKGESNNNNFYYYQLLETLNDISTLINKPLSDCVLENIEFGVNITTTTPVKKIIKSIISNGSRKFAEMNVKKIGLGKVCGNEKSDYELKIYDKGRQSGISKKNILRIEVKVKKMRFLNDYGINCLNSLTSPERIGVLGQVLADLWNKLVYYDGSIDEKNLTNKELLKLKDYKNPMFWESINRKKRYKERICFDNMIETHQPYNEQAQIEKLILLEWRKLVNRKRKNRGHFHQILQSKGCSPKGTYSPLECRVNMSPINREKNGKVLCTKNDIEKRYCLTCQKEITFQKSDSKFCSTVCRNKHNNQIRQQNIVNQRSTEAETLKSVSKLIKKGCYPVMITRATTTGITFQQATTTELQPLKYDELRKITAIEITLNDSKFVFTRTNAKELIKRIIKLNNKDYKNEN